MEEPSKDKTELSADLLQVLGYLNFSSGKCDLKTLAALNRIYGKGSSLTAGSTKDCGFIVE